MVEGSEGYGWGWGRGMGDSAWEIVWGGGWCGQRLIRLRRRPPAARTVAIRVQLCDGITVEEGSGPVEGGQRKQRKQVTQVTRAQYIW